MIEALSALQKLPQQRAAGSAWRKRAAACLARPPDLCLARYEEALAVASGVEFGLSTGIVTQSLKHARNFQRNARAGMTMVNRATTGVDYHAPFGGSKKSSYGPREQGVVP